MEMPGGNTLFIGAKTECNSDKRKSEYNLALLSAENTVIQWSEPIRLTSNENSNYNPHAIFDGDNIYLTWYQEGFDVSDVFFMSSQNYGQSWSSELQISESSQVDYRASISCDDEKIMIFWTRLTSGVFYCTSLDGGNNWGSVEQLEGYAGAPALCKFRPDSVFAFFSEDENYWVKYTSNWGNNWSEDILIGSSRPSGIRAGFGVSNNGIHVTGQSTDLTDTPEIFYHGSPDGGNTWNTDIAISDLDNYASQWSALSADTIGHVYITWFDYAFTGGGLGDIFLRKSNDDGVTWEEIQVLSNSHMVMGNSVAANDSGVYVGWADSRDYISCRADIYLRFSTDQGETWSEEQQVTSANSFSYSPYLITDRNYVHLFWSDNYSNLPIANHIYYMRGQLVQTDIREADQNILNAYINAYPNPFNENVKINIANKEYSGCSSGDFKIEIYNLLGQIVETFSVEDISSKQSLTWTPENEKSGVYFVRVTKEDECITKKIIFLK